jgi:preprotein translocase subunit SecF
MSKLGRIGARLYSGDVAIDFVSPRRRRLWYAISIGIIVVALGGLVIRGVNFGIEFRGGVEFAAKVSSPSSHVEEYTNVVTGTGIEAAQNPTVVASTGDTDTIRVQTEPLTTDEQRVIENALKDAGAGEISTSSIGPTWGGEVANKAIVGLIVFLVLVVLFIWAYFREWRMSAAAIVALAHDVVITVGVYALAGFEVTPSTVTGLLTILGYSLYDTVVVFDKVRENTRGITTSVRRTYAESANLAVNQTLVRSINTSIAALLPVGAILYVGVFQLGSGPLKDLALALFVGMAAGTYSSICIATPLLAQLKMREPAMIAQAKRVATRRATQAREAARAGVGVSAAAAVGAAAADFGPSGDGGDGADSEEWAAPADEPAPPPAPRKPRPAPTNRPTSSAASKRAQPQRQTRSKRGKR